MNWIKAFANHAFGYRTLLPIGASAFSGYLALAQMRLSIDDPDFWLIITCGLLLGLLGWALTTYDSWKQAVKLEREEAKVGVRDQRIEDILAAVTRNDAENVTPLELRDLTKFSTDDLKSASFETVSALREFEEKRRKTITKSMERHPQFSSLSEEERSRDWHRMTNKMAEASDILAADFARNYKPAALAVWMELKRRAPYAPSPKYEPVALELGVLAGADPAALAADEIARLTRYISDD